jgi:hypothetical protein
VSAPVQNAALHRDHVKQQEFAYDRGEFEELEPVDAN